MLIAAGLLEPETPPPVGVMTFVLPASNPDDPAATRYAQAALRSEAQGLASCAEGGRNHALNRAAYSLERLVAGGYLDAAQVVDTLTTAARASGLGDAEIARTIASGTRAGAQNPRTVQLDSESDGIAPGYTLTPEDLIGPVADQAKVSDGTQPPYIGTSPWSFVDLSAHIAGTHEPQATGVLYRSDGLGLFYPGEISWLQGESESGKSWVAQIAAAETIQAGGDVLYIDYESNPAQMVARLKYLGVTAEQFSHFFYIRPQHPALSLLCIGDFTYLMGQKYVLVVLDGVTDALGVEGKSMLDNDEVAAWMRTILRPLAQHTGGAVVAVDHVTKSNDARGRFPIGAQAKLAGVTGVAYLVEPVTAFGMGMVGELAMRVVKDRPGEIRPRCGEYRVSDRSQEVARITIDASVTPYAYRIAPPGNLVITARPALERCIEALENLGVNPTAGRRTVDHLLRAKGHDFSARTIQAALVYLRENEL
jgi:hypothetical protein